MNEHLKRAIDTMNAADYAYREDFDDSLRTAEVWANIAQAEALTRIATALESLATTGCAVGVAEKLRQLAK